MQWSAFLTLAIFAPNVHAMLRFACSQLVVERLDPLVEPGISQSPHLHSIVGGNGFNVTMDPANELPNIATCTSCTFSEDFSNYWTAVMYFRARNGSFKRVPTMGGQFLESANGGITVYYIPPYDNRTKVTAFRKGFRMLVGTPTTRTNANTTEQRQISYRCFDKNFGGEAGAPGTGADTRAMPNKPCLGGIRVNIFFPTCWDGKNLDSPDHKSHVAYPVGGSFETGAPCPATHPVKIPQLFYEVVWDTRAFNDKATWPADGSQPFVWSQGDPTGLGQHADYVFGWKGDALQRAMDAFCNVNCPTLKTQSYATANQCVQGQKVPENIDGWLTALPGTNPVTTV